MINFSDTKVIIMSPKRIGNIEEMLKFEFKWMVPIECEDFTTKTNGKNVTSPLFSTKCFDREIKWQLALYPKGDDKESEKFIYLFFCKI